MFDCIVCWKDEFAAAIASIDVEEVTKCFLPAVGNETAMISDGFVPSTFSMETYGEMEDDSQLELILCLLRAILPPEAIDAIDLIISIIQDLYGIVLFLFEILENGIKIPGEVILFFFGWAEFESGRIVAGFKWWYCMGSVAIFLLAIEIFKLFSTRFIVWTKR